MGELLLYPNKLETVVVPDELQTFAKLGKQLLDVASYETYHPEIERNPFLLVFDEVPQMSRAVWRLPVIGNKYQHEHLAVSVVNTALIISISSLEYYLKNKLMPYSSLTMEHNFGRMNESETLRPISSTTYLPDTKLEYFSDRLDETLDTFEIELPEVEMKAVG